MIYVNLMVLSHFSDVSDLQNFVNVALATAAGGEDDLTHDKLSDLRTVGSGFGALIYKLPKNAGYEDLTKRCKSLWQALQNNPDLPRKLVRADSLFIARIFLLFTDCGEIYQIYLDHCQNPPTIFRHSELMYSCEDYGYLKALATQWSCPGGEKITATFERQQTFSPVYQI